VTDSLHSLQSNSRKLLVLCIASANRTKRKFQTAKQLVYSIKMLWPTKETKMQLQAGAQPGFFKGGGLKLWKQKL